MEISACSRFDFKAVTYGQDMPLATPGIGPIKLAQGDLKNKLYLCKTCNSYGK